MARDDLSHKLKREAKQLLDKQRLIDELHKRYAKYGDAIVGVISEFALKKGGLRILLKKLVPHVPHDEQKQYDLLTRFLQEQGQKDFLERAGGKASAKAASVGEAETPKVWPFVERRSGLERRIAVDRRAKVDLITFRNRRFGRDRRCGKDRRQNPPFVPKNHPCWTPRRKK
jgi:hypothetical protein